MTMATVLKYHYCIWFGALGGVLPYTALLAKEYTNASATQVGLLYTWLPFSVLVGKPLFCAMADKYQCHKTVLLASMMVTLFGYAALLIPPFVPMGQHAWWFFCISVLIANLAMGVVISLNDSLAMRQVTLTGVTYGSIRVWGTVGYGIFGLIAGVVNDFTFTSMPYLTPGLVMFVIVLLADIVLIDLHLTVTTNERTNQRTVQIVGQVSPLTRRPQSVWPQIMKTFDKFPSLYLNCFFVTATGFLTAFHWSFFNWFLEVIQGPDTLLMGLTQLVQCFLGELPFFLISERLISKTGSSHALSLVLFLYGLRYLCYAWLIKPGFGYYVLFVELLQGPTYGLFYCIMTAIAQEYSLKGFEDGVQTPSNIHGPLEDDPRERTYATMQGIMSACYEGAGLGIGSLFAGYAIDALGLQWTWTLGAAVALTMALLNVLLGLTRNYCLRRN